MDKVHCLIYKDAGADVNISRITEGDITINGIQLEDNAIVFTGDVICFGNVVTQLYIKEEEE